MKKLLLSLGAVAAVVAPVAAVVACGADKAPVTPAKTSNANGAQVETKAETPIVITELDKAKTAAIAKAQTGVATATDGEDHTKELIALTASINATKSLDELTALMDSLNEKAQIVSFDETLSAVLNDKGFAISADELKDAVKGLKRNAGDAELSLGKIVAPDAGGAFTILVKGGTVVLPSTVSSEDGAAGSVLEDANGEIFGGALDLDQGAEDGAGYGRLDKADFKDVTSIIVINDENPGFGGTVYQATEFNGQIFKIETKTVNGVGAEQVAISINR